MAIPNRGQPNPLRKISNNLSEFSKSAFSSSPGKSSSTPETPWKKRGSMPRRDFVRIYKEGPFSMVHSRKVGMLDRKKKAEELLKGRLSYSKYGLEISGIEIKKEIIKYKNELLRAKTTAERNDIKGQITRLEDLKKRAGL